MRFDPKTFSQNAEYDDRRNAGRVSVSSTVRCSLGDILDLSATGLRLLSHRSLCGEVRFALLAPGLGVQLTGEVVWSRREGFRRHVVGVRFLDVDAHAAAILTRIASEHRTRRVA